MKVIIIALTSVKTTCFPVPLKKYDVLNDVTNMKYTNDVTNVSSVSKRITIEVFFGDSN